MSFLSRQLGTRICLSQRLFSAKATTSKASPPPARTPGEQTIYEKLHVKFSPTQLLVQDVSGGCGDFYAITIASAAFKDLSTLKQHRLVQNELKDVIKSIHGLQLKTIST